MAVRLGPIWALLGTDRIDSVTGTPGSTAPCASITRTPTVPRGMPAAPSTGTFRNSAFSGTAGSTLSPTTSTPLTSATSWACGTTTGVTACAALNVMLSLMFQSRTRSVIFADSPGASHRVAFEALELVTSGFWRSCGSVNTGR